MRCEVGDVSELRPLGRRFDGPSRGKYGFLSEPTGEEAGTGPRVRITARLDPPIELPGSGWPDPWNSDPPCRVRTAPGAAPGCDDHTIRSVLGELPGAYSTITIGLIAPSEVKESVPEKSAAVCFQTRTYVAFAAQRPRSAVSAL